MAFDLLFGLLLVAMAALGVWRGAVVTGTGLLTLLVGYAGGILGATQWAGWVERTLVVPSLVAPALAGSLGFALAWLLASTAGGLLVAWDAERVEGVDRGPIDRGFGGLFGLARGGLVVVLLALLVNWLDAARDLGAAPGLAALPEAESSTVGAATGGLVESAVSSALSDAGPAAEVAARIAARPGQTLGSMQMILEDERLDQLFEDKLFWTLVQNDSIDYAMNRSAMRSMVIDPAMRERFAQLGLVGEAAREDPDVFKREVAGVLREVAPRVAKIHRDPEVVALAQDPEIQQLVATGDTLALMSHPRIRKLVEQLSSDL